MKNWSVGLIFLGLYCLISTAVVFVAWVFGLAAIRVELLWLMFVASAVTTLTGTVLERRIN